MASLILDIMGLNRNELDEKFKSLSSNALKKELTSHFINLY